MSQHTGVSAEFARIAIAACDGSLSKAISFARSKERLEFRARVLDVLERLEVADGLDVLTYAAELIDRSKAPLDNVKTKQAEELNDSAEFLTQAALKQIEARHKRALSAAASDSLRQMTAIIRSWLRDVMVVDDIQPRSCGQCRSSEERY